MSDLKVGLIDNFLMYLLDVLQKLSRFSNELSHQAALVNFVAAAHPKQLDRTSGMAIVVSVVIKMSLFHPVA